MKRPTLLTQVLAVNALLITATVFAASVAASLHSDPIIERKRFLVLVAALMAMVLVNGWLLRRRFAPLEELIEAMEHVAFGGRDPRAAIPTANVEEVARLHRAFDRMLERLEAERERTATAVLKAQEGERARLARDLHDEANQALTGVPPAPAGHGRARAAGAPRGCARRRASRPRRWRSCCGWRASCDPRRSTTWG
jgi:two-component system sensor histidine kinase UhpB